MNDLLLRLNYIPMKTNPNSNDRNLKTNKLRELLDSKSNPRVSPFSEKIQDKKFSKLNLLKTNKLSREDNNIANNRFDINKIFHSKNISENLRSKFNNVYNQAIEKKGSYNNGESKGLNSNDYMIEHKFVQSETESNLKI